MIDRRAHRQARRDRRDRARQAHPDRDRRRAVARHGDRRATSTSSRRTRRSTSKELPKRILIQGGGYIAVEFAGIFNGLGSEVTLVYRGDNILRGFDDDVREHLRGEMEKRGIKIITKQIVEAIEKVDHGLCVELSDHEDVVVDKVMFATGRRPERPGSGSRSGRRQAGRQGRDRGQRVSRRPRCRTSTRSATSPTASQLTPVAIREGHAFADTRVRRQADARSITPTCRPRCSPSRRSA